MARYRTTGSRGKATDMLASGICRWELESAAQAIGVTADITEANARGDRWRVKLYPLVPEGAYTKSHYRKKGYRGDAPYQRVSVGYGTAGRRVHAVCWHGFRDFFRACFAYKPDAVFRTALATWKGAADFEARFEETAYKNIGPAIAPVAIADACKCSAEESTRRVRQIQSAKVTLMRVADIRKCPHVIIMPEHYRADGTCRCNDPEHVEMRAWGYKWRNGTWG